MNYKEFKKELMKDKEFKEFYENPGLAFEISKKIIDLRIELGLTQSELAKKLKTTKKVIISIEEGKIKEI